MIEKEVLNQSLCRAMVQTALVIGISFSQENMPYARINLEYKDVRDNVICTKINLLLLLKRFVDLNQRYNQNTYCIKITQRADKSQLYLDR